MARYELQAGQHIQADLRQPIDKKTGKRPSHVYKAEAGQPLPVFESDSPLCANDPRKFRRLDAGDSFSSEAGIAVMDAPPRFLAAELEAMTLAQLRDLAVKESIDVDGATTKGVIIRLILAEC